MRQAQERKSVLVVEDGAAMRELLRATLEPEFRVIEAADGAAGVAAAIDLPVLDALEACRRLKADPATRGIPVVVSGGAPDAHCFLGRDVGAIDHAASLLVKPGRPMLLRARVRSILGPDLP